MNEPVRVDGDADMHFLVCEMQENKVAGANLTPRDGDSGVQLFLRRARHLQSGASRRVRHQAAAIETAGGGAAPSIRLAEHGRRGVDERRGSVRAAGTR